MTLNKTIAPAILLAVCLSVTTAPAEAGVLRDAAKQAAQSARGLVAVARIKGSCVVNKLRGRDGGFLCQ